MIKYLSKNSKITLIKGLFFRKQHRFFRKKHSNFYATPLFLLFARSIFLSNGFFLKEK
jgi:hypothetical protein